MNISLQVIDVGDVAMAKQALRRHLRGIFISLPDLVQRFPEMFEAQETALCIEEASQ